MTDLLIVGTGGAGLAAALAAKAAGAHVSIIGKSQAATHAQTSMAQGGINAALGNADRDTVESHIADTLKSARGLCDEAMVRTMCTLAPDAMHWLDSLGVPFSRTKEATIAQRRLGGASHKRACYSQDYTGLKILHTLYDTCLKEEIPFLEGHYLLNLITSPGSGDQKQPQISGVTLLERASGEVREIRAKAVILATGGYSALYHGVTTNALGSTGDGIAAVLRAGGAVSDIEFVQFHPTALKHSSILISESARGEGGYLLNEKGERFVDELEPRDIVARAIHEQIVHGHDVFLDLRHLGEEKLMELLPQEVHLCKLHEGVDPASELIPIKPVAHYSMGGIDVDRSLKVKGIGGCFAVGECSNAKIHGANRLGGNSLLEIIAFGRIAGANAAAHARQATPEANDGTQLEQDIAQITSLFEAEHEINFYHKRAYLGEYFYRHAGIVRNDAELTRTLENVRELQNSLAQMGIGDKSRAHNTNLIDFLEFRNALELGEILLLAALARKESRGAHFRSDFPEQNDDEYAAHAIYTIKEGMPRGYFEKGNE